MACSRVIFTFTFGRLTRRRTVIAVCLTFSPAERVCCAFRTIYTSNLSQAARLSVDDSRSCVPSYRQVGELENTPELGCNVVEGTE